MLDKAAAAVMDTMAAQAPVPSRELLAAAAREAKPVPPADLAAERPADVYPVEVLVGPDMLGSVRVHDWRDAVQQEQDVATTSTFVSKRVRAIAAGAEVKRLKLLRLLLGLIEWYRCLKPGPRGSKTLPAKEDVATAVKAVGSRTQSMIQRKFAPNMSVLPGRFALCTWLTGGLAK